MRRQLCRASFELHNGWRCASAWRSLPAADSQEAKAREAESSGLSKEARPCGPHARESVLLHPAAKSRAPKDMARPRLRQCPFASASKMATHRRPLEACVDQV